jgi:hypothetical protein
VTEEVRKGIYTFDEHQTRYPIKFMQNMMSQFKVPTKIDNGPAIPINRIRTVVDD